MTSFTVPNYPDAEKSNFVSNEVVIAARAALYNRSHLIKRWSRVSRGDDDDEDDDNAFDIKADLPQRVTPLFVFALVWSCGATTHRAGRVKFDEFIRQKGTELGLPGLSSCYVGRSCDFYLHCVKKSNGF